MSQDLSLSDFRTAMDPATIGFPPTLPIEIALKTAPLHVIKDEYGYSDEEWAALRHDPVFLRALKDAVELVRQEGMSFKLKAKLQAEELLKRSWKLAMDTSGQTPPSVQADLIKATMRWAGYDAKDNGPAIAAPSLNIQINM